MLIICAGCGVQKETKTTAKGRPRLAKGWKSHEGEICPACWSKRFILRAITVPVAFPVGRKSKELWDALGKAWAQSTQLANWTVTEMAKSDVTRSGDSTKMPAMEAPYLYPEARSLWPELNPRSVVSILHSVSSRYRRRRLEAVWRSAESLPRYRYPMPYPIHNQAWRIAREDQGFVVSLAIGGEPWKLRLRGGHAFHRQVKALEKVMEGKAAQGELVLYRQRANPGDRRGGGVGREDGDRASWRIMAKIVAWLPREMDGARATDKRVELRTCADKFWEAVTPTGEPWILNADHVKTWIMGNEKLRRRIAEDRKPGIDRRHANRELRLKTTKHHNRIKSFCQMSVSAFVGWAKRCGYGSVYYDDTVQDYFSSFPWEQLRTDLANKCDEFGIILELKRNEKVTAEVNGSGITAGSESSLSGKEEKVTAGETSGESVTAGDVEGNVTAGGEPEATAGREDSTDETEITAD